jgi:hypothetical protein
MRSFPDSLFFHGLPALKTKPLSREEKGKRIGNINKE